MEVGQQFANSSPSVNISSFAVLDTTLKRIVDNNPNLKIIVVCGHSAGGQVVNRYAASSSHVSVICQQNIPVRFIVANPSSYLYMTNERRVGSSLNQFAVPSNYAALMTIGNMACRICFHTPVQWRTFDSAAVQAARGGLPDR